MTDCWSAFSNDLSQKSNIFILSQNLVTICCTNLIFSSVEANLRRELLENEADVPIMLCTEIIIIFMKLLLSLYHHHHYYYYYFILIIIIIVAVIIIIVVIIVVVIITCIQGVKPSMFCAPSQQSPAWNVIFIQGVFFTLGLPLKCPSTKKLI